MAFELFFPQQAQRDACMEAMARLLHSVQGSYTSVLATVDGHLVTHISYNRDRPARVAAMIGSLCALGETLSKEINQRDYRDVLIQTDTGLSVIQRLPKPAQRLVLMTASNNEANLGVLLAHSRTCATSLARLATDPPEL
ncbi:MAG: roadblock/LC7 domain-containing protein [Collimonas sp.]